MREIRMSVFDERDVETGLRTRLRHRNTTKVPGKQLLPCPKITAPHLYSTELQAGEMGNIYLRNDL